MSEENTISIKVNRDSMVIRPIRRLLGSSKFMLAVGALILLAISGASPAELAESAKQLFILVFTLNTAEDFAGKIGNGRAQ